MHYENKIDVSFFFFFFFFFFVVPILLDSGSIQIELIILT